MPLVCFAALPKTQPPDNSSTPEVEVWRIRIANEEQGPIEVSWNQGATWSLIGRVNEPATQSLQGYLAAGYAPIGSVAATAVHGIRIRLGDLDTAYPKLINIVPIEFASTPDGFGGHVAGDSGIYTNIPSGVSLFRSLAPYVGSPCFLQGKGGSLQPLTSSYVPNVGDELVIEVMRRVNEIRSIVFENKVGGNVTVTYADGTSQVVTTVAKPVDGIGRFDGTSYTGVGLINTNHTCVITIGTAPISHSAQLEGEGPERRGGFQIEPSYHNTQTEEVGAPQVMILGPPKAQYPTIEGAAPLFYGGISLFWDPNDPAHSWVCDVQTAATGNAWVPMPEMIGDDDTAIDKRGITAFRLHRDEGDGNPVWLAQTVQAAAEQYQEACAAQAKSGAEALVTGAYTEHTGFGSPAPTIVEFLVDGQYVAITNTPPFTFDWDSRSVSDGEHMIEADAEDAAGNLIMIHRSLVYVDNTTGPIPQTAGTPVTTASSAHN